MEIVELNHSFSGFTYKSLLDSLLWTSPHQLHSFLHNQHLLLQMRIDSYSYVDSDSNSDSDIIRRSATSAPGPRAPGAQLGENPAVNPEMDINNPPPHPDNIGDLTSTTTSSTTSTTGSATLSDPDLLPCQPTNFVRLNEMNASICDTFVIDPLMAHSGGNNANLDINTMNGSVAAKILLLGPKEKNVVAKKAHLVIRTSNGRVTAYIDSINHDSEAPFKLTVNTSNGSIKVYLPHSFTGKIDLSPSNWNGRTDFSLALGAKAQARSSGRGKYRIGAKKEVENEVILNTSNGSIYVGYVDECQEDFRRREARTTWTTFTSPNVHNFHGSFGNFLRNSHNVNFNTYTDYTDGYDRENSYSESSSDTPSDIRPATSSPRTRTPDTRSYTTPNVNIRNVVGPDGVQVNTYINSFNSRTYGPHGREGAARPERGSTMPGSTVNIENSNDVGGGPGISNRIRGFAPGISSRNVNIRNYISNGMQINNYN